jgi:hypothetical protein
MLFGVVVVLFMVMAALVVCFSEVCSVLEVILFRFCKVRNFYYLRLTIGLPPVCLWSSAE